MYVPVPEPGASLRRQARSSTCTIDPCPAVAAATASSSAQLGVAAVRQHAQFDFSGYKRPTILRRITRRLALRRLATMREYADVLGNDPGEAKALAQDILINVTSFFRDPEAFEALKEHVFPELLRHKEEGAPIRIWAPGCSSGEEVYSIAISLFESPAIAGRNIPIKLFGSDLSEQAIEIARTGLYPESRIGGGSPERLTRFFDRRDGAYLIKKRIRDCCVFVKHDLTRDPPFAKLDLISCRNLLIYFDAELQRRVLPMLHHCLNKPGYLFLGASESLTGFSDLFTPIDKGERIYQKTGDSRRIAYPLAVGRGAEARLAGPETPERGQPAREAERQADHYLLARYAPPGVVINERMEIVQYRGRTGAVLESPPGQPQRNVVRMARPGLVGPLHEAIETAKARGEAVRKEGLRLHGDAEGGLPREMNLEVVPLPHLLKSGDRYFLVLFEDAAARTCAEPRSAAPAEVPPAAASDEAGGIKAELAATRSYLEALLGEHQRATDELAAANEELVAANEELQSTNEELQGTQEELQSTNEELSTVNDELRNRNQALDQAASDLVNVLDSVKIPIIIVDGALRVRRFTPLAREISTLIPSDVGRPIDDVKFTVRIEKLPDKIRESLESMMPKEWEVQGDDQRWLRMQIRPYRGTDNRLDGAVLSFIDVDVLKRALQSAEFARDYARGIVATVQTALIVLDSKDRIISLNRAFQEKFNAFASTADGASFFALADGAFRVDALVAAIERSLATRSPFCDLEIQIELPGTGRQTLSFSGRPLSWEGGSPALLLAIEDITERRQHERERAQLLASAQQARIEGERANRAKDLFLATLSHELRTPLSAILMSAELLKQVASADSRVERASAAITRAVSTQARLIDDLLDISRIVSGKLRLHLQAVDLTEIVRNAIDMARTTAEAKGLALQVEVADKLRPLYGDPARLQQVVANLLNNSIKFTPPGGKIAVSLEALDGQARIRITDTGMGIPAELLPRLFDRFVQADSEMTRAHGGLGLGLAIVRYLVEVHGGNVQAESPGPGQGATFQVLLPFAPQTEPTSATAVPAQGTVARSIEHVRVLLIDDEDDTREAFSAALGALGAEVHAARSAAEGLGVLREWKPQVILCDIAMPSEDGYSFARKLRSLSRQQGGQTPAAALTALAGDEDRRRALDAGFQMHLAKPIDSARLAAAIGTLAAWPQPLGLPAEPAP